MCKGKETYDSPFFIMRKTPGSLSPSEYTDAEDVPFVFIKLGARMVLSNTRGCTRIEYNRMKGTEPSNDLIVKASSQ